MIEFLSLTEHKCTSSIIYDRGCNIRTPPSGRDNNSSSIGPNDAPMKKNKHRSKISSRAKLTHVSFQLNIKAYVIAYTRNKTTIYSINKVK